MKKFLIKAKIVLAMIGFWISLKLKLYSLWGAIVRVIADRKLSGEVLPLFTPDEYSKHVAKYARWREDRIKIWKSLPIDNVRSARRFDALLEMIRVRSTELSGQKRVKMNPVEEAIQELWPQNNTDCDDFAHYGACSIDPDFSPFYCAVSSYDHETGRISGHAVVLTVHPEGIVVRGNWPTSPQIGGYKDLRSAARYVSDGMGGEPFTWAIWKVNRSWPEYAKLVDFGIGEPPLHWDGDSLQAVYKAMQNKNEK